MNDFMETKTLKFRSYLKEPILDGTKKVTWRLFDDKNLMIGDHLEFIEWETDNKFAEAEIINVREKKLNELQESDFTGHEKIDNPLVHYRELYGEKVMPDTIIKIITFKLLHDDFS